MRAIHGLVSMGFNPSSATVFFVTHFTRSTLHAPAGLEIGLLSLNFIPPCSFMLNVWEGLRAKTLWFCSNKCR
jgi:hypothetical protein